MKPIRLAVIFDQHIRAGGRYQQALNAALLAKHIPSELAEVLFFTTLQKNVESLASYGIQAEVLRFSLFAKSRSYFRKKIADPRLLSLLKKVERYSPFEKEMIRRRVDLVYFLSASSWAKNLENLNYISTVCDLCHLDEPEFPEVRWDRQLEGRDRNFRAILPRAAAVFVDSDLGKANLAFRYGVASDRIHVMPFQAAESIRENKSDPNTIGLNIREKYELIVPYIFYPAQFWAHKNHVYVVEGLRALEESYGQQIGAIFCGEDKGNLDHIARYVGSVGLGDRIKIVGFVSDEEIISLYRQSLALVMPSYFGPTNLPPLEAFKLGVPVLYPDKMGLRDQVGDAALLMDLTNPASMALHLKRLMESKELREELILSGYERLKYLDNYDRIGTLQKVIEEFRWRRLTWGRPG